MSDLTVFIVQSGKNPNLIPCIDAIKKQSKDFEIKFIKDISPMSSAFQAMIDRCQTKYFVQVDQDMILNRNAVEFLYDKIEEVFQEVVIVGCMLYDPHLDKNIYGVKIYNHDIIKNYPYKNSLSCEVDQIKEFEKDGYRFHFCPEVIGRHSPYWTKDLIFERYFNLMEKFKEFKYNWLQYIPKYLYQKVQQNPTDENLYALLGAYTSISQQQNLQNHEKDFRMLKRNELGRFQSYFDFPTTANLYMTDKCNFKCNFCLRQCDEIEKHPEVTVDLVKKLLTKYPSIKSMCIAGYGEPALSSNFVPVLKYLKQRGIFIGLITNGSIIDKHFAMLQIYKPGYISVSLNASNENLHQKITGTKTFEKVKANIKLLKQLQIPIYISIVVAKEWIDDVQGVLNLAKELNVDGVDIHNLLPHALKKDTEWFENNVLTVNDHQLINKLKTLKNADIIRSYPIVLQKEFCQSCTSPWKAIGMNGNGSLSICSAIFPPDKSFGNINDDSPWFSEGCVEFRDKFLKNEIPQCKSCFRNHIKE